MCIRDRVVLALNGFGVWSLVFGYLGRTVMAATMLWFLAPFRPTLGFDRAMASELMRYGRHISVTALVGFASVNLDYLIIGHVRGVEDLGKYTVAFVVATL